DIFQIIFRREIPGAPWSSCSPVELQNYLAEIGEFGSLAEDARAPGAGTGPCRPSTESCVLTGVWEFKEFVQLQG
ncbi:MAG: hypothetical protein V1244_01080, partial [Nitrospinaceae bacterium]|nr:hypothetical protein [Nitrospinaceae bacterium]